MELPATLENICIGDGVYWNSATVPFDKQSRPYIGKVADIGHIHVELHFPGLIPLLYKIGDLAIVGVIYR